MKKLILLLALLVGLACVVEMRKEAEFSPVVTEPPAPEITEEVIISPSPEPTPEASPEPTPEANPELTPEPLKLEGYDAEQIADYFCEVALGAEYNHGNGDSSALQKWKEPIYFVIYGDYTEEDVALINSFAEQLNQIEGFPGFKPAPLPQMENFTIRFLNRKEMNASAGHVVNDEYADGITLWDYYIASNEIYNTRIWICSEISQYLRNSVILEEIVNSIGLGNDTELREDSIIYQFYSETQELSQMDWLLLRLLYNEQMNSGMHETECRQLISELCN